jgi:hypothetical protein
VSLHRSVSVKLKKSTAAASISPRGAGIFYNDVCHFIFYRKVLNSAGDDSLVVDPDSGDLLNVFNFDQQHPNLYGLKLNMDLHPHPLDWLHFENTFSFSDSARLLLLMLWYCL